MIQNKSLHLRSLKPYYYYECPLLLRHFIYFILVIEMTYLVFLLWHFNVL